jgi:cytochrome c biogenesis protein CcmG/thiol:disulfide interchange protein DsbE
MRQLIWTGVVVVLLAVTNSALAITNGDLFSEKIKFQGLNNPDIGPEQLKGKVSVINFWATWCEACKVEIKEMEKEFAGLFPNAKFNMMFVSLDKDPAASLEWIQKNTTNAAGLVKYLFKDPDFKIAEELQIDSFPFTVVIGPDLKIVLIQKGFEEGKGSTAAIAKAAEAALTSIK